MNTVHLYNIDATYEYILKEDVTLYKNLNNAIAGFFKELNITPDVKTDVKKEIVVEPPVYVKPDKPLSEMTQAERIAYARSRT